MRFPLRLHIATAFSILTLLVGALTGWLGFSRASSILAESTDEISRNVSRTIQGTIALRHEQARTALQLLATNASLPGDDLDTRLRNLPAFAAALESMPTVTAVYCGTASGDYFLLRHLRSGDDATIFEAPVHAHFVVQSIERNGKEPVALFLYLDEQLRELSRIPRPQSLAFDPRTRPWYHTAQQQNGVAITDPYIFFTSGKTGNSMALRLQEGRAVLGVDLRLEDLAQELAQLRPTPSSRLVLLDGSKRIIVTDRPEEKQITAPAGGEASPLPLAQATDPVLAALDSSVPLAAAQDRAARLFSLQGKNWQGNVLQLEHNRNLTGYVGVMIPEDELLVHAHRLRRDMLLLCGMLLLLALVAAQGLARLIARPLSQLVRRTEDLRNFDFEHSVQTFSIIREVDDLATVLELTRSTIGRFLATTRRVAAEEDLDRLLPDLLQSTMESARAEAGVLYLREEGQQLHPAAARTSSGPQTTTALPPLEIGNLPLRLQQAIDGQIPQAGTVTTEEGQCYAGLLPAGIPCVALAVPLLNRRRELVGALFLFNRNSMDAAHIRFIEALSGYAAISLETREMIRAQKALFDAFVRLIAGAIDAKSPYTGEHCLRVPVLTHMLAEAACSVTEGPFGDFHLSPRQWEAVDLAAWMHDCGKVTTPEYVVDKATRLETITDRIHEVRTRFEVAKREAEVACWQAIAAGADRTAAEAMLQRQWQELDEDFAFVARCNSGEFSLSPEDAERLRAIAGRTWTRTLDDRLGLSAEELTRKSSQQPVPLPVAEPLLADRLEHRIPRPPAQAMEERLAALGITLPAPELLYNRGELYNLTNARGTLGEEERYKINEHIIQTLIMLSTLPFPRHLAEVPDLAASHHERMDGKGYPRGLRGEQMTPVARMLAIADVFEALTASNRPYKPGKTLHQALSIMASMRDQGHLDPELFQLFLQADIPNRYAEAHMSEAQRDARDISHYLPSNEAITR